MAKTSSQRWRNTQRNKLRTQKEYDNFALTVGKRYVFFQSLADEENRFYSNFIYNQGIGYVNALQNAIGKDMSQDTKNQESLQRIQNYINFIQKVAQQEQRNEQKFFEQMKSIIEKDPVLQEAFIPYLKDLENGRFNYTEVINLLNVLMKKQTQATKDEERIHQQGMAVLDQNYSNLEAIESDVLTDIDKELNTNGMTKEYRKLVRNFLMNDVLLDNQDENSELTKYQGLLTSLISSKVNSILRTAVDSPAIRDILIQCILNTSANEDDVINAIIPLILNDISELDEQALKHLNVNNYIENLTQTLSSRLGEISQLEAKNAQSVMSKKAGTLGATLEQIAFTTRRGIADIFQKYSASAQNEYFADTTYGEQLRELYNKLISPNSSSKDKAAFSRLLTKAIRERYTARQDFKLPQGDYQTIRDYISQYTNNVFAAQFKNARIDEHIRSSLKLKLKYYDLQEYLIAHRNEWLPLLVMGKSYKFKSDAVATLLFEDNWDQGLFSNIHDNNERNHFRSLITDFLPRMLERYKIANAERGYKYTFSSNVTNAMAIYKLGMEDIKKELEKLESLGQINSKEQREIIEQLKTFLLTSIQVKEYAQYVNQIGVEGGSLGANIESITNNIDKLYELGGIALQDKELILFGLMNCGGDALAHGLKEDLATYLLGGAAMLMFDDGFTATEKFLSQVVQDYGFAMGSLHLYSIQGKYIPASYVYYSVYNSLVKFYSELTAATTIDNISISNHIIINNSISKEDNPGYLTMPKAQDRWNFVADLALKKVDVKFMFMAGLLDIFEGIQQAIVPKV